jgi:hypothetical protein
VALHSIERTLGNLLNPHPKQTFSQSGAHSLDYLDVPVVGDKVWLNEARHKQTRVVLLAGKGRNEIAYLHQCLPLGVELLLQDIDEQHRLVTYKYDAKADQCYEVQHLEEMPSPLEAGVETLFILAGLGGSAGTPQSQALACDDSKKNIPTFTLVSLPFEFEGERLSYAESARAVLERCSDCCLSFRNEDLISIFGGEEKLAKAFDAHKQWLAHALLTIKGLADGSYIRHIINSVGRGNRLQMGFGKASGSNRVKHALTVALENPLLKEMNRHSAHAAVVLSSSVLPSDNEMEQAKKMAAYVLASDCKVTVNALRDPRMGDDLYVTIFLFEKVHSSGE